MYSPCSKLIVWHSCVQHRSSYLTSCSSCCFSMKVSGYRSCPWSPSALIAWEKSSLDILLNISFCVPRKSPWGWVNDIWVFYFGWTIPVWWLLSFSLCSFFAEFPLTSCSLFSLSQHMREAAERRQQLELEHEQALAVLNAKQQEIDLLQKVRGFQPHQTLGWSSFTGQSAEDLASYLRLLVYLNKLDSD